MEIAQVFLIVYLIAKVLKLSILTGIESRVTDLMVRIRNLIRGGGLEVFGGKPTRLQRAANL